MNGIRNSRFILHVSDFHLNDNDQGKELECAKRALKALTQKLKVERIKIDYLIHTGDIIDSSDLYKKACYKLSGNFEQYVVTKQDDDGKDIEVFEIERFKKSASDDEKKQLDEAVRKFTEERFELAETIMKEFISDLNVSFGEVIICSGNHDIIRPLSIEEELITCKKNKNDKNDSWIYSYPEKVEEIFQPFETFLNNLGVANSQNKYGEKEPVFTCALDDLNILILNTNWINPYKQKEGYYCVHCEKVKEAIKEFTKDRYKNEEEYNNKDDQDEKASDTLNIILAHKPIYEICEKARLSFKRYIKTSFMGELQQFLGTRGIYFCGDKHTRSMVGSLFHDISHYIGGEPLCLTDEAQGVREVEYNLLEFIENELSMERKIHLKYKGDKWDCNLRPQDKIVSNLYDLSKEYIIKNSFELIAGVKNFHNWESFCQEIYTWEKDKITEWYENLNNLHRSMCKYRIYGDEEVSLENKEICSFVLTRINEQMKRVQSKNILNIRGEYSSGKSTFLGILYIFLLYQYSIGKINFIPAYFNMENDEIYSRIQSEDSYYKATTKAFSNYVEKIQKIATKERQSVCYIIDGLDEQDCWSYSTEDSVGRGILDILAMYEDAWYIMSYSQHRLPYFKNTMPIRAYNDKSDILYFNPIDIQEDGSEDKRFSSFVEAFFKFKNFPTELMGTATEEKSKVIKTKELIKIECDIIRNFRRLTITPGFMNQHYSYIAAIDIKNKKLLHEGISVTDIYRYYIDRQNELCLQKLGYGFVKYAPAMAYLFAYKGYTYEKFKRLRIENMLNQQHIFEPICENYGKVYQTFLFIKKHRDAREYLIALHYNRELRYYAEHLSQEIPEDSILNQFITRNISVLIRKLWTDTNKFIIACEQLLMREDLSNCMQSMLIYCLAHLEIYAPIRDQLRAKLMQKGEETLLKQRTTKNEIEDDLWKIQGSDNAQKLEDFINLSLKHTMKIFNLIDTGNSTALIKYLLATRSFHNYNLQYQMLYYGDLSIQGEDKRNMLNPNRDIIYKGFDFHNCFNYLYVKLSSKERYPLREFDLYTMWTLLKSRLSKKYLSSHIEKGTCEDTFFYRDTFEKKVNIILRQVEGIFNTYLLENEGLQKTADDKEIYEFFKQAKKRLECEINNRKNK